ncbi:MAG: RidA family protein [Pedosphaera sp.]|nr:RidA family protein [Pedosphaera sp.]
MNTDSERIKIILQVGVAAAILISHSWLAAAEPSNGLVKSFAPDSTTGGATATGVEESAALAHTAQVFPMDRGGRVVATNAESQAGLVLENLDALLKSARSGLAQAVKLNVYLAREDALPRVRATIAARFNGEIKPAVSYVVGDLAEPGALVAMDAVAVGFAETKLVKLFRADGIASVGVLPAGPKLYVSGMADTNSLIPATRKTLEKLVAAIGQLGSQREDIAQLKVFFQPMSEVAAVRKEVADYFGGKAPPTVFVEWISAPPNPPVEIELIAAARGRSPVAAPANVEDRGNLQPIRPVGPAAGGDRPRSDTDSVNFLTPPGTTSTKVYSRVARVNHGKMIYVSGLFGMKSSDAAGQVREIFGSLGEVLKKAGGDFEHLVKATYYVTDNDASNALNDLRPEFYNPLRQPAASKAKVKGVGLPGKTVTLDMIAVAK